MHHRSLGIIGFRTDLPIPAETREKILQTMTVENQNEAIAALLVAGMKPQYRYPDGIDLVGENQVVPKEELYEDILGELNEMDESLERGDYNI